MKKRFLSILLTAVMVMTLLPVSVFAANSVTSINLIIKTGYGETPSVSLDINGGVSPSTAVTYLSPNFTYYQDNTKVQGTLTGGDYTVAVSISTEPVDWSLVSTTITVNSSSEGISHITQSPGEVSFKYSFHVDAPPTIGSILPDDFPTSAETGWINQSNNSMIYIAGAGSAFPLLQVKPVEGDTADLFYLSKTATQNDTDYKYENEGTSITLKMSNNKLSSIVIGGFSDTRAFANGTYAAPPTVGETFTVDGISYLIKSMDPYAVEVIHDNNYSGSITIPEKVTYKGIEFTVTSINKNAFAENQDITSVTIPSTVTGINDDTFSSCSKITSISLPEGLTSIGINAFYGCSNLESITIPSTVISIGAAAFDNCAKLKTVICKAITSPTLGSQAFYRCPDDLVIQVPAASVENYKVATKWSDYSSKIQAIPEPGSEGNPWLIGTPSAVSVKAYIKEGTLYINGEGAMQDYNNYGLQPWKDTRDSITSVIVSSGVTHIGQCAFQSFSSLNNLQLPDSVESIANHAFRSTALTSMTIPAGVTTIGNSVFRDCSFLTSLTVKASIPPTLGTDVFKDSSDLTKIYVPTESVETYKSENSEVSKGWYTYVSYIDEMLQNGTEDYPWQIGTPSAVSVTAYIKDGTLYISGAGAMKDYPNVDAPWVSRKAEITTVMIESGVTHIGESAFENFNALETVYIPSSVTTIGANAFFVISGSKIANLHIDSIESWCEITFSGDQYKRPLNNSISTKKLYINGEETTELVIPGSMKSIPNYTFVGWPITSAVLESGVESIGDYAFQNCGSLESITMTNDVTTIGAAAFSDCSNLKEVTIPSSVTTIGNESFFNCKNLDTVICNATNPPTVDDSFDDCAETLKIYVPANSVSEYKTDWSNYASMIKAIPTIAEILNKAVNFPTTSSSGWTNGNGAYIFRSSENDETDKFYWYGASSPIPLGPVNEPLNGLDYIEFGGGRIIFNLDNNGVLVSITFVGIDDSMNGTYAPSAPAPVYSGGDSSSTITVPVSGDENSVKVQASVSGSTATVKEIPDADLEKVTEGESVSIDLSAAGKNVDTAKIPTQTVEKIAEKSSLTVKLPVATVEFDKVATEEIADQAKGSNIELVVDDIKEVSLNAVQKESVKKLDTAVIIDAHLASNGSRLCTADNGGFGGGSAKVILPYEIKNNRKPENYSVFYVNEAGKLEKLNAVYDEELKAFVFEIEHFSVYAVAFEQFVDIDASAYYYDAVKWAVENGVTDGVDATHFNPSGITDRAQMVTFLWRAAGKPEPTITETPFTDLDPDWYYYKAVLWAYENGITDGTSETTFEPNKNVSRAQVVTFLWRYAGKPYVDYFMNMSDVASGKYYTEAVRWALSEKITDGTTTTTFSPNDDCLRGQIVTFLYRDFAK